MSYVTLADLGRRGGGGGGGRRGGGGWRGGGRRWGGGGYYPYYGYGGGYPYYDAAVYPAPIMVMDPVDPQSDASIQKAKDEAEKAKIQAIAAAVRAELAKGDPSKTGLGEPWLGGPERGTWNSLGQHGTFIDVMGPGARDDEIDSVAKEGEYFDEAIPAQQALTYRQQAGLIDQTPIMTPLGMGDVTPPPPAPRKGGGMLMTGVTILGGAALGYAVGSWLCGRKTG